MNNTNDKAVEQLENAFQLFNQYSEKLAGSYEDLEGHVAQLTDELANERDERLTQLAEKELLARRLETLLDALPAGIVVLDSEGYVIQTNPVSREMLGLGSDDAAVECRNWKNIAESTFVIDDKELKLNDGRWVNISARSPGEYPGKIILLSDVTETHTLQRMLSRQDRLSSLGEMVASLAHQIRTPLASALLYITGINHPANDNEEKIAFAKKAKERLCHLERMVDDMLMFAKGEATDSEYIYAEKLFARLKCIVDPDHKSKRITFIIDENIKNVAVRANGDALLSALQNIIDNAFDACSHTDSKESNVEINALLNDQNELEIDIRDNGCGMTEELKQRALEPFFTTKSSGTGLGLAVVNSTITRYGGAVKIVSQNNIGTDFIITLPRTTVNGMLSSNLASKNIETVNNTYALKERLQIPEVTEGVI